MARRHGIDAFPRGDDSNTKSFKNHGKLCISWKGEMEYAFYMTGMKFACLSESRPVQIRKRNGNPSHHTILINSFKCLTGISFLHVGNGCFLQTLDHFHRSFCFYQFNKIPYVRYGTLNRNDHVSNFPDFPE